MYRVLGASLFVVALAAPLVVSDVQAQTQRAVPRNSQAYNEGYERGARTGGDDGQRNRAFDYASKPDYRNGDSGYRREYGDRERWRGEFRQGFESGYRDGYGRYRPNYGGNGRGNEGWRPGAGGPPPWANGRGRGGYQNNDYAFQNGFTDGYEAGLNDVRRRQRFDPVGEGRYRDGDRGYRGNYGSRDDYRYRYRDAFREGYEQGYQDGRRYDNGNNGRPSWWPW